MAVAQSSAAERKKKGFVRTDVPTAERVGGVVIVGLLIGIGAAIAIKGQRFDPDLYSLPEEALLSTVDAVEGKAATLKMAVAPQATAAGGMAESTDDEEGYGEMAEAAGEAVSQTPLDVKVAGLVAMGPTEFYDSETLFEKINGRAPAYLEFDFQELRSRSFTVGEEGESFIDVFEYRMSSPVNAFGIFSLERDTSAEPVDFVDDGYGGEMGYFFRQGNVYVQVIASDQEPATLEASRAVALDRIKAIPVDDSGLAARRRLPAEGMVDGSLEFVRKNAQGQPFLKEVYQARYAAGGGEVPFFLMVATPAETTAAWDAFHDFSGKYGKVSEVYQVGAARVFVAESFGAFRVVFQRDAELGGAFDAKDLTAAKAFVDDYLSKNP